MESNDELKEIDIKNRACFYFDDIIRIEKIDFDNVLSDKKSNENILIYTFSYGTFMVAKPLPITLDKANGIIKIYDGTRYVELFGSRIYNSLNDTINYLL